MAIMHALALVDTRTWRHSLVRLSSCPACHSLETLLLALSPPRALPPPPCNPTEGEANCLLWSESELGGIPRQSITRTCGNRHVRVGLYRGCLASGLPCSHRSLRCRLKLRARAEAALEMRLWLRSSCSRRDMCSSPMTFCAADGRGTGRGRGALVNRVVP